MSIMDVNTLLKERSEDFKLEVLTGYGGLGRKITVADINRLGLALAGFFDHFPYERIQVIGTIEHTYLKHIEYDDQVKVLNKVFSHEKAVSCVLTRNLEPTDAMIKVFSDLNITLLRTELNSSLFIGDLGYYLDGKFAPSIKIHGVMTNVYGLGVLLVGKSAIGKSECALELVKRGHKLVSDDVVNITKRFGRTLVGSSLELTKHLIEVRGIGIIDVKELFGIGNISDESRIELVIKLEERDSVKQCERVGFNECYTEYLSVRIPEITIPVVPGRNLAILVETASLNQRLKNEGHFTARNLDGRLREELNKK
ncbi:MAG: HPr(Ser) kinase/phosphatase [Endomicrobium sp.]|uniref:HPr(Ser) kinase/phosphatase n=1 Tax=Candidatus Endomicrobiellum pyrsonymphae TaxID=1408203 RepID=UPI0035837B10|nr:HPr(Ser) kinase/phosphatase [Endomicrobium sp.]